ncbi:signal-induced proliferation-associated 1-like protein 1 [Sycon ciliatum]|uniref:signal-induced proliferation-associated 1-like protein 1 n=1 Tax=Sycon ciliatum TaxID=27933 RepID=UPI0031F688C0
MDDSSPSGSGRAGKSKVKGIAHFDAVSLLCNLTDPIDNSKSANEKTGASAASSYDESKAGAENGLVVRAANFVTDIGSVPCESTDGFRDHARWTNSSSTDDVHSQARNKEKSCFVPASCTGVLLETPIQHQLLDTADRERECACNVSVLHQPSTAAEEGELKYRSEHTDMGAYYYRQFFYDNEHQNYFGMDENLGPVAISVKRDFIMPDTSGNSSPTALAGGRGAFAFTEPLSSLSSPVLNNCQSLVTEDICPLYRIIVRTSRLEALRVAVLEECVPDLRPRPSMTSVNVQTVGSTALPARDVISYALPSIQLPCLRLARAEQKVYDSLMRLDEQNICRQVKAGVMYCDSGQSTEEDMYNNINGSSLFKSFLECLGTMVELKGFTRYRAQLDNKNDTTGTHSVYTEYCGNELMFHVSTLLPYTDGKKQQLLRKRHIGNDILTVVFQESDAEPFSPTVIRSQFQHVFIIVRHMPGLETSTSGPMFQVAVTQSSSIPHTPPAIPPNPVFALGPELREFVLAKLVNMENAAHRSAKFLTMAMRTRHDWLVDLVNNYSTMQLLDPQNVSHAWGRITHAFKGKRGKSSAAPLRQAPAGDSRLLGGIAWPVQVTCWDNGTEARPEEYLLCISSRFLCVLREKTQRLYLFIPVDSVIGWTMSIDTGRMCIYYGIGECLQFNLICDEEGSVSEVQDIASRLAQFSDGSLCQEIILQRSTNNHLGFILLGGGTIGEVDPYGVAWKCGVRQNSRVLEINGKPLCGKLRQDLVSQLREKSVTLLLVPPFPSSGRQRYGRPSSLEDSHPHNAARTPQRFSSQGMIIASTPAPKASPGHLSPAQSVSELLDVSPETPIRSPLGSPRSLGPGSPSLAPEKPPRRHSDCFKPALSPPETPTNASLPVSNISRGSELRLSDVRGRTRQLGERTGSQALSVTPYSVSDVQSPMFKGIVAKAKASLAASVAGKTATDRGAEYRANWQSDQQVGSPPDTSSMSPPFHRLPSYPSGRRVRTATQSSQSGEDPLHTNGIRSGDTGTSDESVDANDSDCNPSTSLFDVPENASADQLRQALVRTQSELLRCQHKLAALRKENSSLVRVVEKMRTDPGVASNS